MFTGIVKDVGRVAAIRRQGTSLRMTVQYSNAQEFGDLAIDESVAVSGACQTVVELGERTFDVDTVEETLTKTTLGSYAVGTPVNLERALRPLDRLGGHFVQGHVDCVGAVLSVRDLGGSREIRIGFPDEFTPYIAPVGSIAIDGVSLTVASVTKNSFTVAIIPYTFGNTTLASLKESSRVNLEFDILGKYVFRQRKLVEEREQGPGKISEAWLSEQGY